MLLRKSVLFAVLFGIVFLIGCSKPTTANMPTDTVKVPDVKARKGKDMTRDLLKPPPPPPPPSPSKRQ